MTRFKLDENLPAEAGPLLASSGCEVFTVHQEGMAGASDMAIAEACRNEGLALLTLDLDFSNILRYPPERYSGLIILRPSTLDKFQIMRLISRLLEFLPREPLAGRLWIVGEKGVRIHEGNGSGPEETGPANGSRGSRPG